MIYNKKRGACEAWAQMAWLATSGTQEGRIAHHHTDATVLCKRQSRALHALTLGRDDKEEGKRTLGRDDNGGEAADNHWFS